MSRRLSCGTGRAAGLDQERQCQELGLPCSTGWSLQCCHSCLLCGSSGVQEEPGNAAPLKLHRRLTAQHNKRPTVLPGGPP